MYSKNLEKTLKKSDATKSIIKSKPVKIKTKI
jgi:hypothetical protein